MAAETRKPIGAFEKEKQITAPAASPANEAANLRCRVVYFECYVQYGSSSSVFRTRAHGLYIHGTWFRF